LPGKGTLFRKTKSDPPDQGSNACPNIIGCVSDWVTRSLYNQARFRRMVLKRVNRLWLVDSEF
jgi:hypothetical protein